MQGIYSGTVTLLFCWNEAFFFYCYKNSHLQKGKKYLHKSVLSLAFSNPSLSIKCNTNTANTSQKVLAPHAGKNVHTSDDNLIFLKSECRHVHTPETQDIHMHFTPTKKNKQKKNLVTLTAIWDTNLTLNRGFLKKNSIVHFCCSPH